MGNNKRPAPKYKAGDEVEVQDEGLGYLGIISIVPPSWTHGGWRYNIDNCKAARKQWYEEEIKPSGYGLKRLCSDWAQKAIHDGLKEEKAVNMGNNKRPAPKYKAGDEVTVLIAGQALIGIIGLPPPSWTHGGWEYKIEGLGGEWNESDISHVSKAVKGCLTGPKGCLTGPNKKSAKYQVIGLMEGGSKPIGMILKEFGSEGEASKWMLDTMEKLEVLGNCCSWTIGKSPTLTIQKVVDMEEGDIDE